MCRRRQPAHQEKHRENALWRTTRRYRSWPLARKHHPVRKPRADRRPSRHHPALALAKRFVDDGRIGTIRHVRAQYLQDWLSDPLAPLTWRLDRQKAGSGALGDIGAHSIDTAQWMTGQSIDAVAFTAELSGGALGVFEATRLALGRRNANRIEINGDRGSVAFDFERMNELEYFDGTDAEDSEGFRRIQVTDPVHPYAAHWWPTGHGLGYEHLLTHQVVDLVTDISGRRQPSPSFASALQIQRVLAAVQLSAANESRYTKVSLNTAKR
ncbi:gfo/Idh/MocA family oxidoreductase [Subtercola vilae]|uniref:Gfo/Idh/MocA family oxidoreductase n=1 Tax=Subtercola vilae TaxID=2056433 RepID=A0A4T2BQI3_9MICO|nr:gfo/Idh/MocA family oxidoreductase [Subtercola vilae]